MPWARASFRSSLIYARVDDGGALVVDKGLVEIRYKLGDARAYRARADGLKLVDGAALVADDAFPVGVSAPETKKAGGARAVSPAQSPFGPSRAARPASAPVALGTPPENAVIAYTDGACTGNPGPAGLGVVLIDQGKATELSEYLGEGTNNIAELSAVYRAIQSVADPSRAVVVHTDSKYAIGVLTKGWKAKANTALITNIRAELAGRPNVSFVYVPGHAGVPLNERADELARGAILHRRRGPDAQAGGA